MSPILPHMKKTYCSRFQDEELISEIFSRMLNRVLFAGLMVSSEILVDDSPISRRLMALIITLIIIRT